MEREAVAIDEVFGVAQDVSVPPGVVDLQLVVPEHKQTSVRALSIDRINWTLLECAPVGVLILGVGQGVEGLRLSEGLQTSSERPLRLLEYD